MISRPSEAPVWHLMRKGVAGPSSLSNQGLRTSRWRPHIGFLRLGYTLQATMACFYCPVSSEKLFLGWLLFIFVFFPAVNTMVLVHILIPRAQLLVTCSSKCPQMSFSNIHLQVIFKCCMNADILNKTNKKKKNTQTNKKNMTVDWIFFWCKVMSLGKHIIQNIFAGSQHGVTLIARGWETQLHRTTLDLCKSSFKTLSNWIWRMFVAALLKGSLTVQGGRLWAIKFCNLFLPTEEKGHMFLWDSVTFTPVHFYLTYKL